MEEKCAAEEREPSPLEEPSRPEESTKLMDTEETDQPEDAGQLCNLNFALSAQSGVQWKKRLRF